MDNTSDRRRRRRSPRIERKHFFSPASANSEPTSDPQRAADEIGAETPVVGVPLWKRTFDILLILLSLPLVLPVALGVAAWIRLVSPGHVLFKQTRIGRGGRPFTIYKFRSMKMASTTRTHEEHVEHLVSSNQPMTKLDVHGDARLIKGGYLVRMSGLDELPQLLNVLRGEMSLVGPRPCLPNELRFYAKYGHERFSVQPGLTGLWQVSRSERTTFEGMVNFDDQYAGSVNAWRDLGIVLRTPPALIKQLQQSRRSAIKATPSRASDALAVSGFSQPMSATQKLN